MVSSFLRRVINRATNSGAEHAARNQAEAMEDTCSASSRAAEAGGGRGEGGGWCPVWSRRGCGESSSNKPVPRFGQHAAGDASGREEITDLVTRSCCSW